MPPMIRSWQTVVVCMGFMLATGLSMSPAGAHDDQNAVSSAPRPAPTLPSTNDADNGSVVIGDGIRTPPDIGAAGTASSTPPIRFESPTNKTDIFQETTPVPQGSPAAPEGFPSADPTPLEQPELFKK